MPKAVKEYLSSFLGREGITSFASLPITECYFDESKAKRVRLEFTPKSALVLIIPYFVSLGENLSAYATAEDYHAYAEGLGNQLVTHLKSLFPHEQFRFFCDKSPLSERYAAARAGLGVLGDNGLLITHTYGSFVFLAEVLSTLPADAFECASVVEVQGCIHCGACKKACPTGCLEDWSRPCLSAITQKKGELTEEEASLTKENGSVWGCDICQLACPMNKKQPTPIPFFHQKRITCITKELLDEMSESDFQRRAFSWRGKAPLYRNLSLFFNETKE